MAQIIRLKEDQVPLGIRVNLYLGENNNPEIIDGEPMVLYALIGGIPKRKKLYHIIPH